MAEVTRIVLTRAARDDLIRLADFWRETAPDVAERAVEAVLDGLQILRRYPQIGRPSGEGHRDLVISFGRTGYVARYRFVPSTDEALVLRVRHQREIGFDEHS
jgi:plasmid stabilization system protein ParE